MKSDKHHLHIVSFNIPYPPDYGGVIDVYYRIKALHQLGVKIYLHCFEYGRDHAPELQKYCEEVYYYKRKVGILSFLSTQPYIVKSRKSHDLLKNLSSIQAPILFEGEHSTAYFDHKALEAYPKWVRLHNIEHRYYNHLALQSTQLFSQFYYRIEAMKLSRYEQKLSKANGLLCISQDECIHFKEVNRNTHWLAAFHAEFNEQSQIFESDSYLYHGDLTVDFNLNLVGKLANLYKGRDEKLSVAGKMKPRQLRELRSLYPWINLLPNLSHEEMRSTLFRHPHHLIFAEHKEGVKIKLIHSLYTGANVIANDKAVNGSGLEKIVKVIQLDQLEDYMDEESSKSVQSEHRSTPTLLDQLYNNTKNAERLLQLIFDE